MQILDRLKMELSNQQYFTDEQYTQFLAENNLLSENTYIKGIYGLYEDIYNLFLLLSNGIIL